ncbi:hypothetical protein DYBT9275_02065 [Dyadobacter sp. CECT 9275]|uniref:Uncharacterized protein n=1 Tax=Dyadobacter helix TaxID=2822344 RepID=A0A916JBF5_9BACT|nr:hypothetical protein DYBT9275_02065 [Dyadobacter sp. CECT 9275]
MKVQNYEIHLDLTYLNTANALLNDERDMFLYNLLFWNLPH